MSNNDKPVLTVGQNVIVPVRLITLALTESDVRFLLSALNFVGVQGLDAIDQAYHLAHMFKDLLVPVAPDMPKVGIPTDAKPA